MAPSEKVIAFMGRSVDLYTFSPGDTRRVWLLNMERERERDKKKTSKTDVQEGNPNRHRSDGIPDGGQPADEDGQEY